MASRGSTNVAVTEGHLVEKGKGGEIAVNNREDQTIAILALHLLQISLVYINTLLVQKVLSEKEWLDKMAIFAQRTEKVK